MACHQNCFTCVVQQNTERRCKHVPFIWCYTMWCWSHVLGFAFVYPRLFYRMWCRWLHAGCGTISLPDFVSLCEHLYMSVHMVFCPVYMDMCLSLFRRPRIRLTPKPLSSDRFLTEVLFLSCSSSCSSVHLLFFRAHLFRLSLSGVILDLVSSSPAGKPWLTMRRHQMVLRYCQKSRLILSKIHHYY